MLPIKHVAYFIFQDNLKGFEKKFIREVYEVVINNKVQEMPLSMMQVLILITESKKIISFHEIK